MFLLQFVDHRALTRNVPLLNTREKGLLLIGGIPCAALNKVPDCRLHGFCLLDRQGARCSLSHQAKDFEKLLDAAMAILEHPKGIVESGVEFCANLYRHDLL